MRASATGSRSDRRGFVSSICVVGASAFGPWLASSGSAPPAGQPRRDGPDDEVSPAEDLMREHGVLKRVLLVYGEAIRRIDTNQDVPPDTVREAANIVRTFIEDYHERLEEDYLFPRFEKARRLTELTAVLRSQHKAGRRLTDEISHLATAPSLKAPDSAARLRDRLHQFRRMYEPHEAREDTVLFPALRTIVSAHEYGALGEDFEKKEHQLFGDDGFERMVERVEGLEKQLGIYDLSLFTPKG